MQNIQQSKPSLAITYIFFIFITVLSGLFFALNIPLVIEAYNVESLRIFIEELVFLIIMIFILYGNIIYFLTRIGNIERERNHQPPSRLEIDTFLKRLDLPTLTILIPSYKEEQAVIFMTVLSAVMQPYPHKRIALLIDDPNPTTEEDVQLLRDARAIPVLIQQLFTPLLSAVKNEHGIEQALTNLCLSIESILHKDTHTLFFMEIMKTAIDDYKKEIKKGALEGVLIELNDILDTEVVTFERKQFDNLSHEPNKAMNLNSYIGLMGGTYDIVKKAGLSYIQQSDAGTLSIPDSDLVMTLDADSILRPEYVDRLVYHLLQPGNEKLAVIQTPYNAFPHADRKLEYVAGATTDIQYLIHQGFTKYGATYWVGANAIIRKAALEDIKHSFVERGYTVWRYVHDRTVIEDTESSIDLMVKGWKLYNYPERLAYSATPPDFGSLIVQRRRWANGGLLIFPKLLWYFLRRWYRKGMRLEFFVRAHYLVSIAGVNIGLLLLIFYPFDKGVHYISLIIIASLPYFVFYTLDLLRIGYTWTDVFPVYGLNLLLIPVNIAGVTKSVQQGITMKKIPFGRTPKVQDRTSVPVFYIIFELVLIGYLLFAACTDLYAFRWEHAIFSIINCGFFLYAYHLFIGFRHSFTDLKQAFTKKLF